MPTMKGFWNRILPNPEHCRRCGRRIYNGSEICYKCNKEFQKFMRSHHLKDYSSLEEVEKRWRDFIADHQT